MKPYLLHAYRKKKKQNRADDEASAYGKARRIIASLFLWRGAYIPIMCQFTHYKADDKLCFFAIEKYGRNSMAFSMKEKIGKKG